MESINDKIKRFAETLGKKPRKGKPADYQSLRKIYDMQANEDVRRLQKEAKTKRIASLHGRSDLNPKWVFDTLDIDSEDTNEAVSIAQSFIAAHDDPNWRQSSAHMMIFYGDYGRGKSHIAGSIAHELIETYEITVLYRQLSSLLEMRQSSFDFSAQDNAGEKFRQINHDLLEVDLLILDEVCVNESILKKHSQSWLGNLLRQRLVNKKNCILITNHNLADLEIALGQYCFESIKEYDTYKVHFQGPSRRKPIEDEYPTDSTYKPKYVPNQIK
ncbi:ATP-binding protein [Alteromonas sp. a30]|uniref:ATP-binding protein n=1 Tax=Alteromonas sp. a30 TaxID=2730917 RepID=UPI00227E8E35|nr:ATP-binding protein [Alteromonas sp. a30]MCY7295410.1 ATP-binding protein [Alteromonas sp. a30]